MKFLTDIEIENTNENRRILREAYWYAYKHSDDTSTKVGGAIKDPHTGDIAYGTNRITDFPRKLIEPWMLERPAKYSYIKHSEWNTIRNAQAKDIQTQGATMWLNWFPCYTHNKEGTSCTHELIEAGIAKLVVHEDMVVQTRPDWEKSLTDAYEYLRTNNITITKFQGRMSVPAQMNGTWWMDHRGR